jgi:anthranilate phosphoribosyltransferase
MTSLKEIIQKLLAQETLGGDEANDVMIALASGNIPSAQVAAFMTIYMMRPINVEELAGFRKALLDLALEVDLGAEDSIDMCGTGGDGKNSFNISTIASLVVAGAGYKVTKHGNYGVSSVCGSSNVLEFLGYQFTNDANILKDQLEMANICFLHAPLFHPALKSVGPIRRELSMKTFFNMLGPLVNPARPTHQFVGVFSQELSRLYSYLLQSSETKNYTVVHSMDGYDEISLTGSFLMVSRETEVIVHPSEIKLPVIQPESIFGGDTIEEAADIFTSVLGGNGTNAQNEVVCANAGIAIHCLRPDIPISECLDQARASLLDGHAMNKLELLTKDA